MTLSTRIFCLSLAALISLCACGPHTEINQAHTKSMPELPTIAITPLPASVVAQTGEFVLQADTKITFTTSDLADVADYFSQLANPATGFNLSVQMGEPSANSINLIKQTHQEFGNENPEAYKLVVNTKQIDIYATTNAGLFYGLQSLRQLLPAEFNTQAAVNSVEWKIPAVIIEDRPLYPYRGMHLDVSRHFMPTWFIKRYIDLLAFHKMNYFHWHLTDDQGWRIQIDAYPLLTERSAWRNNTIVGHTHDRNPFFDKTPEGGFYTKEQIREIVAYAKTRQITIIPEIDIPGHASAVLHAYPEFGCENYESQVQNKFGIFQDVLCPTEQTFEFLNVMFTEVSELFPGEYLHVGGDEVLKDQWQKSAFCQQLMQREGLKDYHELQSYFIRRVSGIVTKLNKKMIGWDEILEGGLAENATIMSWRGVEGGIAAAKMHHKAIMAPGNYTYFDAFQSRSIQEPLAIHGLTPLSEVYSYNPMPEELKATEFEQYILGAQGQLWTEYVATPRKAEYMVLPRMSALAEIVWTPVAQQNWKSFSLRLPALFAHFDKMELNASRSVFSINTQNTTQGSGETAVHSVQLSSDTELVNIRYTLDGSEPKTDSLLYSHPITVSTSTLVRAKSQDKYTGDFYYESRIRTVSHKAVGAKVTLLTTADTAWNKEPALTLVDGISSKDQIFQLDDWATFWGKTAEIQLELSKIETISELSFTFNPGLLRQMFPPQRVELFSSSDGETWSLIASAENGVLSKAQSQVELHFDKIETRFLKLIAEIHDPVAGDDPGTTRSVALYLDEIVVK